ncbi:MAG: hypothetical protein ACKO2P_17490 [Planctomycetota bacterium]
MSRIVAVWESIVSSPMWVRDRATLFSGGMVGLTALLLNAVLLWALLMITEASRFLEPLLQQFSFGELMGPVLLAGVVAVLTLVVPLRFCGVLMGPRLFRYFDQVVLTGISPLQFLIGRVASQNVYLLLVLFLLLPWLVLVLALGGLDWPTFVCNLLLVWLYCNMLAMLMAWLCLYMPEWIAMGFLYGAAAVFCGLGIAPIAGQPAVLTPLPALLHPLLIGYSNAMSGEFLVRSYPGVFFSCAGAMSLVFAGALLGVHLGPLWGLIRENSTFGDVVFAGDNRLKRRLRFRHHIQRPSELAFFYQNRGGWLCSSEGLIRWLGLLAVITGLALPCWIWWAAGAGRMISAAFPVYAVMAAASVAQLLHGATLVLTVILFSQGVNTTLQRIPFVSGWRVRVSWLDWSGFLLVLVVSTGVCLLLTNDLGAAWQAALKTKAQESIPARLAGVRFESMSLEVTLITSSCAVTVYLLQRLICLVCWLKTTAASITAGLWFVCGCMLPGFAGVYLSESAALFPQQRQIGEQLAMLSPLIAWIERFRGAPPSFGYDHSLVGFFLLQWVLWGVLGMLIVRRERRLLRELAAWQSAPHGPCLEGGAA